MYIKQYFKYESLSKNEKEYKSLLKELTNLDVRRIAKLNLLAIYGATKILKNKEYKQNMSIYTSTQFACIQESFKVLQEIKEQSPIMPFDFLNINTNNMGFYISKVLDTIGNNYTISSEFLSFEKTLHTIFLEYKNKVNNSFLIGNIESALENLPSLESFSYIENNTYNDISSWIYFDDSSKNSIAKLEKIEYFSSINSLNIFLQNQKYDIVALNYFSTLFKNELNIDQSLIKTYSKFSSSSNIINLINGDFKDSIFISLDSKKRAYVLCFTK